MKNNFPTTAVTSQDVLVNEYVELSAAANTIRAYKSDWATFRSWCNTQGELWPPSEHGVARYLAWCADQGYKPSSIQRYRAAIGQAYQLLGLQNPSEGSIVKKTWQGIKRKHRIAPDAKEPLLVEDLKRIVTVLPTGLIGLRDRALLLLGFAAALRRSELVGLDVENIEEVQEGLKILVLQSKGDQEGAGRLVGVPYGSYLETCPVRNYKAWLATSGIKTGAVFRPINRHGQLQLTRLSSAAVNKIVKRSVVEIDFDEDAYGGHSLRSGLATSAARAGKSEHTIMLQTGHKSVQMVRKYIHEGTLFRENAAANIGL